MLKNPETLERLLSVPGLVVYQDIPLRRFTRFGIGGPASIVAETDSETAFTKAARVIRETGAASVVIGAGTNLVVSDGGFDGVVLRFTGRELSAEGGRVRAGAGAELQALVDFTIERGRAGLETMTGIPGWVGAAVYGNAGAYGRSISEVVREVRYFDGSGRHAADKAACGFRYRESVFKRCKDRVIFSVELELRPAPADELRDRAAEIRQVRDRKYPPEMRCAGSIFKNLLRDELPAAAVAQVPERVVREGKVPAAWFLEQTGAKGLRRGDIQVADYHANLIYNDGAGTASDLRGLIEELKRRVRERFGFELEEEVQYVGF